MEEVRLDQSPPQKNEKDFCPRTHVEIMSEDKGIWKISSRDSPEWSF